MKTILIVEDEQDDARQLEGVVKSFGNIYKLIFAKSGMEAIEQLKKSKIDLVLLDITLPGYISGSNLLFRKEMSNIPVIVVSKMEEVDLKVLKVKFSNIVCYLRKPIDEKVLHDEILNAFRV